MDAFLHIPWRIYPATLAMLAGGALSWRALVMLSACRALAEPARALHMARGIRVGIMGLCIVAFGAGWLWSMAWMVVLATIIFGEEMLETSIIVAALRDAERTRAGSRESASRR